MIVAAFAQTQPTLVKNLLAVYSMYDIDDGLISLVFRNKKTAIGPFRTVDNIFFNQFLQQLADSVFIFIGKFRYFLYTRLGVEMRP